eukprot:g2437.t1
MMVIFGRSIDALATSLTNGTNHVYQLATNGALNFLYLGIAINVFGIIGLLLINNVVNRVVIRLKKKSFANLLQQDMCFFANIESAGAFTQRLEEAFFVLRQGLSKTAMGKLAFSLGSLITGFTFAFMIRYDLALVLLATWPLFLIISIVFLGLGKTFSERLQVSKSKASRIAAESFEYIQQITSLNAQEQMANDYTHALEAVQEIAISAELIFGSFVGISSGLFGCTLALALFYGTKLVVESLRSEECVSIITSGGVAPPEQCLSAGRMLSGTL